MVVVLTAAAIAAGTAVGVWAEKRWPQGAALASRRALVLMLYVLIPPIIFFNLAAAQIDLDHGVGIGLGLLTSSLTALFAWSIADRVMKLPRPQTGAVVCTVLSVNTGYLGYPLTVALLGRDQLSTAVLYDVLVTGPCLLLGAFAIGAAFGTRAGKGHAKGCRRSSPETLRSTPRSPACWRLRPSPRTSPSTSRRLCSSRSCHSGSSPSAQPSPRTRSRASCRCPHP
jgi:malate permease and related proteins